MQELDQDRTYAAQDVQALIDTAVEETRDAWRQWHEIQLASKVLEHREELRLAQAALGTEQRRNRIDAEKLITAAEDAAMLASIRAEVRHPKPSWYAARRAYLAVHRIVFGGGLQ